MTTLFEKIIDSGTWTLLRTPTEKIIIAWFATKYPDQSLSSLDTELSIKMTMQGIGNTRVTSVRNTIATLLANNVFVERYCALQEDYKKILEEVRNSFGKVSEKFPKDFGNLSDPKKEKEKQEEERFPHTPSKEGERKEKEKNISISNAPAIDDAAQVKPARKQKASAEFVTSGQDAKGNVHTVVGSANARKDKVINKDDKAVDLSDLKYPNEYLQFVHDYPNRVSCRGSAPLSLKQAWKWCEEQGWTGPEILAALANAIAKWNEQKNPFIPFAKRFLEEEWMLTYLPQKTPVQEVQLRFEAEFEEFVRIYPRKGDFTVQKIAETRALWKELEVRGWQGYDINRAVNAALYSKQWTQDDGRFIPSAKRFLEEEQMRNFLPIGFQVSPTTTCAETPDPEDKEHEGMIYKMGVWWTPEELRAYVDDYVLPERLKGRL